MNQIVNKAAKALHESKYVLISAGAGMGADSGLPVFRGTEGFWTQYKPFDKKYSFSDCANPAFLQKNPHLFWGFYGHRLNMYRNTKPHAGFTMLLQYIKKAGKKAFVLTSNVDGHFQKAGFPSHQVYQIHGTINHTQCDKCLTIKQSPTNIQVSKETMMATSIPLCQKCGVALRPNILMFGDMSYCDDLQREANANFDRFCTVSAGERCVLEIGAGEYVPTIRRMSERLGGRNLIRINPDSDGAGHLHIKAGGLQGIKMVITKAIDYS